MTSHWLAQLSHLCDSMYADFTPPWRPEFLGPGPFYVGGAMSGTSLDGLDLALVSFWQDGTRWRHEILQSTCISYEGSPWARRLPESYRLTGSALNRVSWDYSQWLNEAFHAFFDGTPVQAIASHGHTVHHLPAQGITRQIGQDSPLMNGFGETPIICDFRVGDVTRGGQGAPLVPLADAFLYPDYAVCLNLGGFCNASWIQDGKRRAGDLGPANVLLNHFAQACGYAFDPQGQIARTHDADDSILKVLQELPFYAQDFPKSLGREWVESEVLPLFLDVTPQTALATATHHAAWAIHHGQRHAPPGEVLVTGGGAQNQYFMSLLEQDSTRSWVIPSETERDFKEAICFAFLGLRRLRGEVNIWGSVTGASLDGCDGTILVETPLNT
jgi:anhydro-N-acetylmuramic acid kinase